MYTHTKQRTQATRIDVANLFGEQQFRRDGVFPSDKSNGGPVKTVMSYANESISYDCHSPFNACEHSVEDARIDTPCAGRYTWTAPCAVDIPMSTAKLPRWSHKAFNGLLWTEPLWSAAPLPVDRREMDLVYAKQQAKVNLQAGAGAYVRDYNWARDIAELKDTPSLAKSVNSLFTLSRWLPKAVTRGTLTWTEAFTSTPRTLAGLYLADRFGVRPTKDAVDKWLGSTGKPVKFAIQTSRTHIQQGETLRVAYTAESSRLRAIEESTERAVHDAISYQYSRSYDGGPGHYETSDPPNGIRGGYCTGMFVFEPQTMGLAENAWPTVTRRTYQLESVDGVVFAKAPSSADLPYEAGDKASDYINDMTYELTPFSFLVDWFVDIGSWLENQNRLYRARYAGLSLLGSDIWMTEKHRIDTYGFAPYFNYRCSEPEILWHNPGGWGAYRVDRTMELGVKSVRLKTGRYFKRAQMDGPSLWAPLRIGKLDAYKIGPTLALLLQGVTPLKAAKAALKENPVSIIYRLGR